MLSNKKLAKGWRRGWLIGQLTLTRKRLTAAVESEDLFTDSEKASITILKAHVKTLEKKLKGK